MAAICKGSGLAAVLIVVLTILASIGRGTKRRERLLLERAKQQHDYPTGTHSPTIVGRDISVAILKPSADPMRSISGVSAVPLVFACRL